MDKQVISKTASLGNNVVLGSNVQIMDYSIIRDNVVIGDNVFVGPYSIIGEYLNSFYEKPEAYSSPKTSIGKDSVIRSHAVVYAGCVLGDGFRSGHSIIIRENSVFGSHCLFGSFCQSDAEVRVGNYVRCHSSVFLTGGMNIGDYSCLYPHVVTTDVRYPPYRGNALPPRIGSKCIIGGGSLLLSGVTIGNGAFIGAGSLVTRDIPEEMLAVGRPARPMKNVAEIHDSDMGENISYPFDEEIIRKWER